MAGKTQYSATTHNVRMRKNNNEFDSTIYTMRPYPGVMAHLIWMLRVSCADSIVCSAYQYRGSSTGRRRSLPQGPERFLIWSLIWPQRHPIPCLICHYGAYRIDLKLMWILHSIYFDAGDINCNPPQKKKTNKQPTMSIFLLTTKTTTTLFILWV